MKLHHSTLPYAAEKKSLLSAIVCSLFVFCFSMPAFAHNPFGDIEIKVWASQSFDDPFCSDDPIDIYFRVNSLSYITVYQINPWGGVEILYPLARHRWKPVYPGRTYRLTDLSYDLALLYNGVEGNAYIGMVATRQPIDIVPWLEAGFRDCGLVFGRPERVVVGVDFQLAINHVLADVRLRLGTACAPAYYVAPLYVRPRVVVRRPPVRAFEPPIFVWPTPPRHKSPPPKWGNRDGYYSPQPEPPAKRPFHRRGNETPEERYRTPDSGKSSEAERSVKRSNEAKVKNDSSSGNRGGPSKGSERRVKKSRN